jgi:uncharacterized protein YdeI (YjbR/CyaY-like superfamily)
MPIETDRFATVDIANAAQWRDWLAAHYRQSESVWAVTSLKSVPDRYVSRFELLDEALCYGWIDGLRRKLDDRRTMQLFSPRRHQRWTATYRARVSKLIKEGRVAAPGLDAIKRSKRDGTWLAMPEVDALVVPEDLAAALEAAPPAEATFAAVSPSSRRNMLRWIAHAKTEQTRARRVHTVADHAANGIKVPLM